MFVARPKPTNEYEASLLDNIAKHGWHCTSVFGEGGAPGFTYTVGLFDSYQHPELLVIGLSGQLSHHMISNVATAARKDEPLDLGAASDDILEGFSCVFAQVPVERYADYVLSARWYYRGDDFPLYQIVWPDEQGNYPWNPEADDKLLAAQPVLGDSGH